jgi:uncharacterized protein (DUF2345 family)
MPETKATPAQLMQGITLKLGLPHVVQIAPPVKVGAHPIEFRLLNAKGDPMPPMPYKLTLPNGEVKTGQSDAQGYVRYLENPDPGQAKLVILDKGGHPIEILLTDASDAPMPNKPYRLTMPNGAVHEGVSDADGFIRHPENDHEGEAHLTLTDYS